MIIIKVCDNCQKSGRMFMMGEKPCAECSGLTRSIVYTLCLDCSQNKNKCIACGVKLESAG